MDLHLSDNTLAALVEGNLTGEERARAQEHLARCRTCFAAYSDGVKIQSLWIDEPESFAPGPEVIEMARESVSVGAGSPLHHRPARRGFARPAWIALAAGLAAVLLVLQPKLFEPPAFSDPTVVALVERAAERASAHGMVLPFGEGFTVADMTVYRAGAVESDADLSSAISALIERYESDPTPERTTCLLISGQIAAGQIGNARAFVAEARGSRPDEPCLALLAAIIAYRDNDPAHAEQLLRQVLGREPDNLAAGFNLGLLLTEAGRTDEARPWLEAVMQARPRSALASRAAALVEGTPPR